MHDPDILTMGAEGIVVVTSGTSATSSNDDIASPTLKQPTATINAVDKDSGPRPNLRDDDESREAFLSTFSVDESKAIRSKVDRRFFILIGLMFMIKNVRGCLPPTSRTWCSTVVTNSWIKQMDNTNASLIKVLQVGQPSNILNELGMSRNEYNWVASIYGVCRPEAARQLLIMEGLTIVRSHTLLLSSPAPWY